MKPINDGALGLVVTFLLMYRISMEILHGITDYATRQYLVILQDELKRVRMLYEERKMSGEDYRKLESELAEAIREVRVQQSMLGRRHLDLRLV